MVNRCTAITSCKDIELLQRTIFQIFLQFLHLYYKIFSLKNAFYRVFYPRQRKDFKYKLLIVSL